MTVGELLDQIRDYYVSRFLDAVRERSKPEGVSVIAEAPLCSGDGQPVEEGELGLPMRSDLHVVRDGQVTDSVHVDTEGMLSFEPVSFLWKESLQVSLSPFQWNSVELSLPQSGRRDWTELVEWFRRWFEGDDGISRPPFSVVHFLSDPDLADETTRFSIDLGTAPVEAFEALLDAVVSMGFREVKVGNENDA